MRIQPSGASYWQYRYRFAEKERVLSLGPYPSVSLSEARERRVEAEKLLRENKDPSLYKQQEKLLAAYRDRNTFLAVAEEWALRNQSIWSAKHADKTWGRLQNHVLPYLGKRPVTEITTIEVLSVIQRIEAKGLTHMSRRVLQLCQSVFRFGKITGRLQQNPAEDLSEALKKHHTQHYPTLNAEELPKFLSCFSSLEASHLNIIAFQLLLHTALRTGELRHSKWAHIDLEARVWKLPAETMKMKRAHQVPISRQVWKLLTELQGLTGHREWILPNQQRGRVNPVMSEATILRMIDRMGYKGKIVGHGFRSLFSTILNENGFNRDAIERQLAHSETNQVRAAYNRAEYWEDRCKMMQWWSDYLEQTSPQLSTAKKPVLALVNDYSFEEKITAAQSEPSGENSLL